MPPAFLALIVLAVPAAAQEVSLARYTAADGLPSPRVTAALQDSRGFLWFGTPAGAARYDGTEFRVYSTADGLSGNQVVGIVEAADGSILVATRDGGVDAIAATGAVPVAKYGHGVLQQMRRLEDGRVYLAGDRIAGVLGPSGLEPLTAALPEGCCTSVGRDAQGRIWLGTLTGLYGIESGRLWRVPGIDTRVHVLLETAAGIMVGTQRGLYRIEGGRLRDLDVALPSPVVRSLFADPEEGVWVGTDGGAVRVVGSVRDRLTAGRGLHDSRVGAMLIDREGTLWLGTDSGLLKWVPSNFAIYTSAQGLVGELVVDVVPDGDDGVWAATREALVRITAAGDVVSRRRIDDRDIGALERAPDGTIYLGVDRRLITAAGDREQTTAVATLPSAITALIARADGIDVGTDTGLFRVVGGKVQPLDLPVGAEITALAVDREGRLWVGTAREGVWSERGGGFLRRDGAEPLPTVWDIGVAADGSVWAATNGAGVARWTGDGEAVRLTRQRNGLASDFVQQILIGSDGRVWFYTNRGLDRWDTRTGVTHFDLDDGLISLTGTAGAGVTSPDGTLWMGTPQGLTVYRRGVDRTEASPPRVLIRHVEVDGREVPAERLMRLRSNASSIAFSYTALTFRYEKSTLFRYRMNGLTDWSPPTRDRRASYAGLAPGSYIFEVRAVNDLGVWSEPVAVPLTVVPSLWQTGWFRGLLFVVSVLLVASVFRSRLRSLDNDRRRLRAMVDRRTRELVEKNSLLERMATTDELTGLPNRRFFLESMQRELRKMSRAATDEEISLLVIDLDRFKSINDRFGHPAGDDVLREVARRLSRGVRATDLPARYGGEEFAILLPATSSDGARFLAEKLRTDIEALDLRLDSQRIPVTISVGVATIGSPERYAPEIEEGLLRAADEAMYEAKESGRNRVVVAG